MPRNWLRRELNLTDDTGEDPDACQPPAGAVSPEYRGPAPSGLLVPCKTITVYPIWAWAIIRGHKSIENRSWRTNHRGRLAIHAGRGRKTEAEDRTFIEGLGIRVPGGLARGVILGAVELVGCEPYSGPLEDDPWACGPWCWILKNPRPFRQPIPATGKLSLWACQVPAEV